MPNHAASERSSILDAVIIAGLAAGGLLGVAGTMVADPGLRQVLWLIDGTGLVIATTLLAIRWIRAGDDLMGAGFLVFAMGECLLIAGNAAGLTGGAAAFGGGVALWAAGLLMTSLPSRFPAWVRATGSTGGVLFAVIALRIARGEGLSPIDRPLPFFAYPFVVATFVGWIVETRRR